MLKFNLVNGYVKFVSFGVDDGKRAHRFYDEHSKNEFCQKLDQQAISYTVIDYDEPSTELLRAVEGKKFNTIAEAREFVEAVQDGIVPKTDSERINDLELLVLQLGGIIE